MNGYCLRCKANKEIKNCKDVVCKNGRTAHRGNCPDCNTIISKFYKKVVA